MKNRMLANIHWLIILYAGWNLFTIFEEKTEQIEQIELNLPSMESQIITQRRKLAKIKKFRKELAESKERVEEVTKQIQKVQRQLPAEVKETEVAGSINDLASNFRFQESKITPKEEELKGFYFAKNYDFTAKGTFLQSLIFFENLEKSERILNVLDVEMKNDEQNRRGKFQVLEMRTGIESYRYNTNYKEKSGVEEIENKFKVK